MIKKKFTTLAFIATIFTTSANETEESKQLSLNSKNGKYSLSLTGNLDMRVAYDFNGSITSYPDFVPSLISVPGDYSTQEFFYMDATTSRVVVTGTAKTEKVGNVELYLNMDFRGGSMGSYTPRLRMAYISAAGFVVGRNITTFLDLGYAPPTIDFQGPNAYPFIYTTQIRYVHGLLDNRLKLCAALEHHGYTSMSLSDGYEAQNIYLPTVPAYVEYSWDSQLGSHVRLTGLYKSNPIYDTVNNRDINLHGWGAQLSGSLGIGEYIKLYYGGTCGEGITDFIQDLYGSELDVTMTSGADSQPQLTFMYGWQTSSSMHLTKRALMTFGYSSVKICGDASSFDSDDYRKGDYAYANIFYSITPRITVATEYLWGKRKNVDNCSNTANRINTMFQYSF